MPNVQRPPHVLSLRIDTLKPDPTKACRHKPSQIRHIAENIAMLGVAIPVVVDDKGTIRLGHRRFLAAKSLGMARVPVVRVSHLTSVQRIAFLIAEREEASGGGRRPSDYL